MKYCVFCGKKIEDDSTFCPHCGGKQEGISCSNEEMNASGEETNTLAILAIIFTFVFTIVGLILGILGMNKAKQMNGKGFGLSLAAVIISALSIVMEIVAIIILIAFWGTYFEEAINSTSVFLLFF